MTLFVYKFIGQAKKILFVVLKKKWEYRNRFLTTNCRECKKSLHCIAIQISFGGEKNMQNAGY